MVINKQQQLQFSRGERIFECNMIEKSEEVIVISVSYVMERT